LIAGGVRGLNELLCLLNVLEGMCLSLLTMCTKPLTTVALHQMHVVMYAGQQNCLSSVVTTPSLHALLPQVFIHPDTLSNIVMLALLHGILVT